MTNPNLQTEEKKEERGGILPLIGAGAQGGPSAGPTGFFTRLFGADTFARVALNPSGAGSLSLGTRLAALVRSPFMLGTLLGVTAITAGYGMVRVAQSMSEPPVPRRAVSMRGVARSDASQARKASADSSLDFLRAANQGAFGEPPAAGFDSPQGEAPKPDTAQGEPSASAMGAEAKPDASKLMAAMAEKMKGEGKEGKAGGLGGGAMGASSLGGGASSSASLAKGADLGGSPSREPEKRPGIVRSGTTALGVRGARSALGQLKATQKLSSGAAQYGGGETASYLATKAFEGSTGDEGAALETTSGTGTQDGPATGNTGTGASTGGVTGDTNGSGGDEDEDGEDDGDDGDGDKKTTSGTNVTPYQDLVDYAETLIAVACVLLALAGICGLIGKTYPVFYKVAKYLAYAAMAAAAIATLLGVAIIAQGQMTQGAIYTVVGAVLTALSYVAADSYGSSAETAVKDAAEPVAEEAWEKSAESLALGNSSGDGSTEILRNARLGGTSSISSNPAATGSASTPQQLSLDDYVNAGFDRWS